MQRLHGQVAALVVASSAWLTLNASAADALVGRTFWLDRGESPVSFVRQTEDATKFGQEIPPGHSFTIIGVVDLGMFTGYYKIQADDGRQMIIDPVEFRARRARGNWSSELQSSQHIFATAPDKLSAAGLAGDESEVRQQRESRKKEATAKAAAERAAWLAKPNVAIGMTAAQARSSRWGSPSSINRTVTARGSSEQWVYGNGYYLFFENDVLVAIHSSQ